MNDVSETLGFPHFYVKTRKENNTYLIYQFIIENVELRLIENGWKNHRDIVWLLLSMSVCGQW